MDNNNNLLFIYKEWVENEIKKEIPNMNENISSSRLEAMKLKYLFSKFIAENLNDKENMKIEELAYW